MLVFILAIIYIQVAYGNKCGVVPYGNCLHTCYAECIAKIQDLAAQSVTDPQLEEQIVTDNFVCQGKCRGNVITPKNLNGYDNDFYQCVEPCGNPLNQECTKGYLPKFFYCDCLKCCKTKTGKDDSSCAAACFEWFLKPDAPPGVTDVPSVANKITLCTSRCASFFENGEHWDFETKLSNEYCISEPERCMSSVKVTKINVTKGITDAEITAAPKEGERDVRTNYINSAAGTVVVPNEYIEKPLNENFEFRRCLIINWPAAFNDMLTSGFVITCDPTVATGITYPTPASSKIDWPGVTRMLVSAFNADKSNAGTNREIRVDHMITISQGVKLHTCEIYEYYGWVTKPKGLSIAFEIHAEVSEINGLSPKSKDQLKTDFKNGMWYGLEYVSDGTSDNTVLVKGVATAEVRFEIEAKLKGTCKFNTITHTQVNGEVWKCENPAHDVTAGCVCTQNC